MTADGKIYAKDNALSIKFADRTGHPLQIADVRLDLSMNMPGMVMHSSAKMEKQNSPGEYLAHLTPEMAGDWNADLSYQGPQGVTTFQVPISVTQ
jgi:hypothetical protein